MTNSIIFYRKKGDIKPSFQNYDCCENLGANMNDNQAREMYIGLPKDHLDPFFFNMENLSSYLKFITECLDIEFLLATEEEVDNFGAWGSCSRKRDQLIMVKGIIVPTPAEGSTPIQRPTNKYFNSAYNLVRYLWYQRYTPIAIVATNLYRLNILSPIDVLAIASSFQRDNVRCLLPTKTNELNGILFFMSKEAIIRNLMSNTMFNRVFYMYPVYFNPKIVVKGSFFADAEREIAAKEEIFKLASIDSIDDLPGFARSSFRIISEEYLAMKAIYVSLTDQLGKQGLSMDFNDPLLISRDMKERRLALHNAIGTNDNRYISITDGVVSISKESMANAKPKQQKADMPF